MDECWVDSPGWEGLYQVSNQGRVRSLRRATSSGIRGGRVLKPSVGSDGYLLVAFSRDGKVKTQRVHQLVMVAFVGDRPDQAEIAHENGQAQDNRLENLSYKDKSGNMLDSVRHGTHRNVRKGVCPTCQGEYRLNGRGQRVCRACVNRKNRERYAEDPTATLDRQRSRRATDPERVREIERVSKAKARKEKRGILS